MDFFKRNYRTKTMVRAALAKAAISICCGQVARGTAGKGHFVKQNRTHNGKSPDFIRRPPRPHLSGLAEKPGDAFARKRIGICGKR